MSLPHLLLPWKQIDTVNTGHIDYRRCSIKNDFYYTIYRASTDKKQWYFYDTKGYIHYRNSAEEAMKDYDIDLINFGAILLTEEQAEKYKVLL